ncbi:L-rhamnose mutarotase [Escherichia coli]|nr:L-rhamnose mutarotase [Escherichia coli]
MIRKAFVMQVNPDAHEEYQRRHNPIWYRNWKQC